MKRIISLFLAAICLILILSACAGNSYTPLYYETHELMDSALDFKMRDVPELDTPISYAAVDGKLGEITYAVYDETRGEYAVTFRMATLDYAEKYSSATDAPGISGVAASEISSERLGSATVTYYGSGSVIVAVWTLGDYAYSVSVEFANKSVSPVRDDVYGYALAIIATQ